MYTYSVFVHTYWMYILYTSIYTYRYDMPWYARVFGNEYESLWEYIIYNRYIIQDLVPSSLNSRAWQVKQVANFESNMRTSRFVCSMCMSFPILQGLNSLWIFMVCQGVPKSWCPQRIQNQTILVLKPMVLGDSPFVLLVSQVSPQSNSRSCSCWFQAEETHRPNPAVSHASSCGVRKKHGNLIETYWYLMF